jgi:tetratricopeptide (TPR) repeat protein
VSAQFRRALGVGLLPLLLLACEPAAPPNMPTQPTPAGGNPTPGQPQIGMSDSSSAPTSGTPNATGRPMNAQAQGYYAQGLQAFATGDLAMAKQAFQAATAADPQSHQSFYSLGVVQQRLRDSGAASSFRQAYTIVADYEPAIIAGAMLMAKKGSLGDADRLLTDKRARMPKSAAVAAALAEVKSLQKDTGSAQRIAQEALKINPDYRPAMVIIARDHYRNRRLDLALYALQAILDGFGEDNPPRDKNNAEAHLLRGLIYREQGKRGDAMEAFQKAMTLRPDLVEARVHYATYLLEAGDAGAALPILEGAKRFDADNVAARLNLGDAYRLLGKYDLAKQEFSWVVAKDASLAQVHYDLGLLYLFAPSIPGLTPKQQVNQATAELKKFQELRDRSVTDDSDELLNRAKLKEGEIDAAIQAQNPPAAVEPAPTAPAGG